MGRPPSRAGLCAVANCAREGPRDQGIRMSSTALSAARLPAAIRGIFTLPGSRPLLVIACLLVASALEGIGIATLLPVLAMAAGQEPGGSGLQAFLVRALGRSACRRPSAC